MPAPRADWKPTPQFDAALERRTALHKQAERRLESLPWLAPILQGLKLAFKDFWEFAIAEADAKGRAAEGKRRMRDKGRNLVLCRRLGADPQEYLDAMRALQATLPGPRDRGRPSLAPFHDLVAYAWLGWLIRGADERLPRLERLRGFLEVPELGYPLPKGRISRVANSVLGKVVRGESLDAYPKTASVVQSCQIHFVGNPSRRRSSL